MNKQRCSWAKSSLMMNYHDNYWGIPCHDDQQLFELLTLETFQAGLSWEIVLKKQTAFEEAFDSFNIASVAHFSSQDVEHFLQNKQIIRNRQKINAMIHNAKVIQNLPCSFDHYLWQFTNNITIKNHYQTYADIPTKTPLSIKISQQMKKDGFKFTGPVVIQSFIEAAGLVNDHEINCFKY